MESEPRSLSRRHLLLGLSSSLVAPSCTARRTGWNGHRPEAHAPLAALDGQPLPEIAVQYLAPLAEQGPLAGPGQGIGVALLSEHRLLAGGLGFAAEDRPMVPETVFEIGSITKTFTALLLATLVADGTVKLGSEVSSLLPRDVNLNVKGRPITLEDLATHTSGLPRIAKQSVPAPKDDPYAAETIPGLYEVLAGVEPKAPPRVREAYSNLGFTLLGHCLELATKRTYAELLRERITIPLAMADTVIELDDVRGARLAVPHARDGTPVPAWSFGELPGAGAIRSTASDLVRYARAHLRPPPLLRSAVELVLQPRLRQTTKFARSLGWSRSNTGIFFHNGHTGGTQAILCADFATGSVATAFANTKGHEIEAAGFGLLFIARGRTPPRRRAEGEDRRQETG